MNNELGGSEPVINKDNPRELTWGKWSVAASCEVSTWDGEGLNYVVSLDFHGDEDGGETGMYGKLSTSGVFHSLEEAAAQANKFRVILSSIHVEDGAEDEDEYIRQLDLSGIIDTACSMMRNGLYAEIKGTPDA